jgi:hypothetical protein
MRSEDDLTYKLGEVIKASTNVRKSEQGGSPAHIVTEYKQLLQVCEIQYAFGRSLFLNIFQFHVATWTMTLQAFHRRCKSLVVR